MPTYAGPSAGDLLRLSARRYPDRACFVTGNGAEQSFALTNSRVNQLVDALRRRGFEKGDRLAIVGANSVPYAELLLASLKLSTIYVPINNRLSGPEFASLLEHAAPHALFIDQRYATLLKPLLSSLTNLRLTAILDSAADGFESYEDIVLSGDDVEPGIEVLAEDIVGLSYTSGTTGTPKGVLQSDQMIRNLVTSITLDYEIQPDEFRYSSSPMFHIGGQSPVFMHLWRGFPTLLLPQFDVDTVLQWMQTGGLSGCFLVPTMISALLAHPKVSHAQYTGLRSIIYGAAPMPPSVLRRALEVFRCDFVNAFGAGTETGLQTVLGSADHRRAAAGGEHLLGSIGKPAYGVDLRLVDEQDRDVERGQVGEIVTRNAQMMSGYLNLPHETQRALHGGWFRAGDLAWMDGEGYLYLAGRRNDMIIRGGENIYPLEIEDVLCAHPSVDQAAVVGRRDDHWGEVVVAAVVPSPGVELDQQQLRSHCRSNLATYKVPDEVVVVDALPVNASGKVMRSTLRDRLKGSPGGPSVAPAQLVNER